MGTDRKLWRALALPIICVGVVSWLFGPTVAHAREAYWWTGASDGRCIGGSGTVETEMKAAGATDFTDSATFPSTADWSDIDVFVVVCPRVAISTANKNAIKDHVDKGGKLVIIGEGDSYWQTATHANDLLSHVGAASRFVLDNIGTAKVVGSHPLTTSVGTLSYTFGSSITAGSAATKFFQDSGDWVGVVEGRTIMVGDWSFWKSTLAGNKQFMRNVWTWEPCVRSTMYRDRDGDGYGDSGTTVYACSGYTGFSKTSGDCDDTSAITYPGAPEVIGDGKDQSCDGKETCYVDSDDDGYRTTGTVVSGDPDCSDTGEALATEPAGDCNDSNATINPGATEIIGDEVDQDCDGQESCYANSDGDGYRTTDVITSSDADCSDSGEAKSTLPSGDCNDSDSSIYPGATEIISDGIDQDCDTRELCYRDQDGDSWRTNTTIISVNLSCTDSGEAPASMAAPDCDDLDPLTNPGATEIIADGKDQTCDGAEVCYVNVDGDGYRIDTTVASTDPDCSDSGEALRTLPSGDCDDTEPTTYPGAFEVIGDEVDQDCDDTERCYQDLDNDGYRTLLTSVSTDVDCTDSGEATASEPSGDCKDNDAAINPAATEIPYDGIDQDCSGRDLCDVDGDGVDAPTGSCFGTDCDDDDDDISPLATEIWYDDVDQDCDGWSDYDADYDGFDSDRFGGDDCNDDDEDISPDAEEIWYDAVDQDCDGTSDFDADGDGFESEDWGGTDCDDEDDLVYPGAPELEDGVDNDCNGVSESDDSDGDGIPDELEIAFGTDPLDADSDDDGVPDDEEWGEDLEAPIDSDDDGVLDAADPDDDGDGLLTIDEGTDDTDEDGLPDHLDLDSDDDGISDAFEGLDDADADGTPNAYDLDSDDDSIPDAEEQDGDSDGDGLPNRIDPDDDGDGWSTFEESGWPEDVDQDGLANALDTDSDGDGIADSEEPVQDIDCDGVDSVIDSDDFDGPCRPPQIEEELYFGGCRGANTVGSSGLASLFIPLILLAVRRRRTGV